MMKHFQRNLGIAAFISLLIYFVALWSEAAYRAGDIGFSEELTWQRMIEAYRLTTFDHVMQLQMLPMGIIAVIGMIAAIVAGFLPHRRIPVWAWSAYLVALLISGGWMGLLMLPFVPFETLDGEFLDEGLSRFTACGIWAALLIALLLHRLVKSRKITEQDVDMNQVEDMRLNKTIKGLMAPLMTAMIFLCVSGGKAETPSTEAKEKLIEQCIRQMTEPAADGTGKAMAFQMLQELGPDAESAVPALIKALDHKDSYVRIQSAYTLWKVDRQAKAIPLLSKALKDTEIETRERAMAASSLGEIGPSAKAALPALREATKAQDAQIRISAAWALWAVDQQSELAKPVLIDALKNDDLNVFSRAAWALGEIGFDEPGLTALGEAIRDDLKSDSKAYAAERVLPGLANALNSNDAGIRRKAISVMSLMSKTISASRSRNTAQAAIIALTKTKKDDEDPAIRAAAAEVLKKIDPKVMPEAGTKSGGKKNPATDLSDPEAVAKAFITALANKNVAEAAKYIIPEERDELKKELKKGMPPLPKDPKVQIQLKENGTRADVSLLNAQKPASGPPIGLDMKLSNGKWWIVK